jgi:hypothetical protein
MFPHGKYANHPRDEDLLPQAIRDALYRWSRLFTEHGRGYGGGMGSVHFHV